MTVITGIFEVNFVVLLSLASIRRPLSERQLAICKSFTQGRNRIGRNALHNHVPAGMAENNGR